MRLYQNFIESNRYQYSGQSKSKCRQNLVRGQFMVASNQLVKLKKVSFGRISFSIEVKRVHRYVSNVRENINQHKPHNYGELKPYLKLPAENTSHLSFIERIYYTRNVLYKNLQNKMLRVCIARLFQKESSRHVFNFFNGFLFLEDKIMGN